MVVVVVVVVVAMVIVVVIVDLDVVFVHGFSVVVKSSSLDLECKMGTRILAKIMSPNITPIETMISQWRTIFKD